MKTSRLYPISIFSFLLLIMLGSGCETEFDPYAPEETVFVIYGILNPQDSMQFVRISEAFRSEGDALVYAAENDLSIKGLQVTVEGNGHLYELEPTTDYPREADGLFPEAQTVYQFRTDGSPGAPALATSVRYDLQIGSTDGGGVIRAHTLIPEFPEIRSPDGEYGSINGLTCRRSLGLQNELEVKFRSVETVACSDRRLYYDITVKFDYSENGVDKQVQWGPTVPFICSEGCSGSARTVCYKLAENRLINYFKTFMPEQSGTTYEYASFPDCGPDADALVKPLVFQVAAMDEAFSTYRLANSPTVTDLTGARREYTNIEAEGMQGFGIFGSINVDEEYFILGQCAEYKLRLNGTQAPFFGCDD